MSSKDYGFINESPEDYCKRLKIKPEKIEKISKARHKKRNIYINKIKKEIKRFLTKLNLDSPYLNEKIFLHYSNIYEKINYNSKSRNYKIVCALTVYLYCIENYHFFNKKLFFTLIDGKRSYFLRGLKMIYKNDQNLFNKLKSNAYRRQFIFNIILLIQNRFRLSNKFFFITINYFYKNFDHLKNRKEEVIVLFSIAKYFKRYNLKEPSLYQICNFLGIQLSILANNKKFLQKEV